MNFTALFEIAQARFPEPEFIAYKVPEMNLESFVYDYGFVRIILICILMALTGLAIYRWRSRKILLTISAVALIILGFILPACLCSVGAFQNIALATTHQEIPLSVETLLLFSIPLIVALFVGRLFCMGACPLGALQELFHIKTISVPLWADRLGRYFAYLVLASSITLAATNGEFLACKIDPYVPIFRFSFPKVAAIISITFLIIGLFIYRPYCRFICPYGVLLRFCALFASKKVMIAPEKCVNCKLCQQGCPNNAILPNDPLKPPETHAKSVKRTIHILLLTPIAMAVLGAVFFVAGFYLAKIHPNALLLSDLNLQRQNHRTEAFAQSGTSMETLVEMVQNNTTKIELIMLTFGMIGGLILMIELLALLRRSARKEHEVDSGTCVMCGRCYEQCPPELARRKKGNKA